MERTQRILIVDDERFNINVLNGLLSSQYKIMAATSGQQALKAARSENQPKLILLDIMMPEMDGYEVCRQLKAADATTAMALVSDCNIILGEPSLASEVPGPIRP